MSPTPSSSPSATIPTDLEGFDATWLTSALRTSVPDVEVTHVDVDEITHGTATRARLRLTYRRETPVGPESLWLKTGCEPHAAYLATIGTYENEVNFYAQVREHLSVRTPQCYFAAFDASAPQFVLLLEDLRAHGVTWGAPGSTSVDDVTAAIDAFARVHARWWADEGPAAFPWLQSTSVGGVADHYRRRDDAVLSRALERPRAHELPAALRDAGGLVHAFRAVLDLSATPPRCVVHGDAHVGNVFFDPDGTPGLLDWQGIKRARWAYDLTQFLVSALSIADRRAHEQDLLGHYLARLEDLGVGRPSWDAAWLDYRRHTIYPLVGWLCTDGYQPESVAAANVAQFGAAAADFDLLARFD
jgi:aminoglycoside/choline kinase family phosphotransferase